MRKILMLIPALNAGGAERVMVTLANEWSKENDVTIMVFNDGLCFYSLSDKVKIKPMKLMPKRKKISRLLSIPAIELRRYKTIKKEIEKSRYDFVLSFCYTTNLIASLIAANDKDKHIIVSERNDPYGYNKIIRWVINRLYRKCSVVVCQNNMVKDYFTRKGFKNNLIVLPNPVNFDDIPAERPQIIEKSLVTVGRLIEQKNHKLLINAFNQIKDEFPDYKLRIYGIGPLADGLKNQISDLGLQDRVFLMGTKKHVMYEVNKCSIFVLSSDFEGFPNVLIEAMATGMPVISSNFRTGIAELLITNNINGYIFEVGNEEKLINCLRKLIMCEDQFLEMGEKNKKIALMYRDEIIAKKWMDIISRCIK